MRMRWRKAAGARPEVLATIVAALLLVVPVWAARGVIIVGEPEPRVALKAYPADLVYGKLPDRVTPRFDPPLPVQLEPVARGFFPGPTRPPIPSSPCPAAGPNVFPEEPAGFDVAGAVTPGLYRWQQEGTIELATIPIKAAPFSVRTIANLRTQSDGSFTYDVESAGLLGRRVESFLVRPGNSIALTGMTIFATDGNRRDFQPVTPVTLLPLPVTIGGTVTGLGVDPINLRTMAVSGTVKERIRVDACGEIVDAWLIEGTREFRDLDNPTAAPGTYNYAIAPQLGGLFVYDHVVENGTTATEPPLPYRVDITARIGQLDPSGGES